MLLLDFHYGLAEPVASLLIMVRLHLGRIGGETFSQVMTI